MDLEAVTMISALAVILIVGSRIPSRPLRKWEFVFDAVARRRGISVALVFLAALTMRAAETWTHMHYIAPGTAVVYLIVAQAMRHLRTWGRRRLATGFLLAWSMP